MATSDIPLKTALLTVAPEARLMGLDLGSKTIGVATSDRTRMIATPIETIARKKFTDDANRIIAIAAGENIGLIVLGLPVNMDGTEGPRCQSTRAFARNFARLSAIPIVFWDERLSTAAVERMLIEADASRAKRDQVIDKLAAALDSASGFELAQMTTIFLALLPVFIVILAGLALRRFHVIRDEHWAALDQICYFVLFPCIIFKEIAAADFASVPVLQMALAMMLAVLAMFALLLALHRPIMAALAIDGPQFTSLLQGASRWHTFIAFAIIPLQFGPKALSLGAVSAAAMTPLLNILCVIVMTRFISTAKLDARLLALSIIRNPFVFSSLGGVAWQLTGFTLPAMGLQVLDMIGRGALGLALLTVGAGLRLGDAVSAWPPLAAAAVLKLVVMPLIMAGALLMMGVGGQAFAVAMLCAAVPTGSGAYVLARQMGGDAPMVANILTLQVIAAAITIPAVLYFAGLTG